MAEISDTMIYAIWAVAIILFGIAEAVTAQLVSIWFVIGAVGGLIAAFCGANLYVQLIVFIAVSVLALVITRPLVKKYIKPKTEHTNADRILNQECIVTEEINNLKGIGQVKGDGKVWTARSADDSVIPAGSVVKVEKISGVKLIVKLK
ncbi:MAG: NfeD family protein [Eubacteriales bacterium]|nr:NfeD family protein [Eubacteriales bacterium]